MKAADPVITLNTTKAPLAAPEEPAKGRVITFYSYKGGTGRSMALANIAWLLALNNQRVLAIDWDLEAPGLHRFFHPFIADKELSDSRGLLDFVADLAAQSATSGEDGASEEIDPMEYILSLEWPRDSVSQVNWKTFGERARIDFLPAGRQGPAYSKKLASFDWVEFYERLGGRRLLSRAKGTLQSVYDYILIDSRTGVSDTSGICTVELPDTVVICFTLNDQSILGAEAVAQSIRQQRGANRSITLERSGRRDVDFRIFPVPSRVEITSERAKREAALDLAQRLFVSFLPDGPRDEPTKYWGSVQMAYFPFYAFEEIPAVFGDRPNELLSLTTSIKHVARLVTNLPLEHPLRFARGEEQAEQARKEILRWYLRPSADGVPDAVRGFQDVVEHLDAPGQTELKRVLLRLVVVGSTTNPSAKSTATEEFSSSQLRIVQSLTDRGLLLMGDAGGRSTIEFADPLVVQRWQRLKSWIDDDRSFLIWRLGLGAALESWRNNGQDQSFCLRGKALDEAVAIASARQDDLSVREREYIGESAASAKSLLEVEGRRVETVAERLEQDKLDLERRKLDLEGHKVETERRRQELEHELRRQRTYSSRRWAIAVVGAGLLAMLLMAYQFLAAEQRQRQLAAESAHEVMRSQQQLMELTKQLKSLEDQNSAQRTELTKLLKKQRGSAK